MQANRDGHLDRPTARHERGVEDDVARDGHGVRQVAIDLVQDVLGRPAEEDGACFWGRAFRQEGKVSVGRLSLPVYMWKKKKDFYSSPIFSMLNSPHRVPISDSRRSSTRFTIVAPTARAMRLLSDLRTRRSAETFALAKKYCA